MGLFETLGRKVGEFTTEAKASAAQEATHRCRECGSLWYTAKSTCPDCGSEDIVELDRSTDNSDDEGTDDGNAEAET